MPCTIDLQGFQAFMRASIKISKIASGGQKTGCQTSFLPFETVEFFDLF